MGTDEGRKIAGALKAMRSLHADTSKLLLDCDKFIGNGRPSVLGNFATKDLTYNVRADYWMPEGVYRFYKAGPLMVDAITVTFFKPGEDIEPVLKVGRIQYTNSPGEVVDDVKNICDRWDLWWLYFEVRHERPLDRMLESGAADSKRIAWASFIAVPLFSIHKLEDVQVLMERVVKASPTADALSF